MVLRTISINYNDILKFDRFDSKFYYNISLIEEIYKKLNFVQIKDLEKEKYLILNSGTTPNFSDIKTKENNIHFFRSADIKRNSLNFITNSFINEKTHSKQKNSNVIQGDILLTNTGKYLGFSSIVPKKITKGNINQNIIRIRFIKENYMNNVFLNFFFNSKTGQNIIESFLTLTGQKYLNMNKLRDFKIPKNISKDLKHFCNNTYLEIEKLNEKSDLLLEEAKNLFYKTLNIDFEKIKKPKFFSVNLNEFKEDDLWTPKFSYPFYKNIITEIKKKFKVVRIEEICDIKKGDEVGSENYKSYLESKENDISFIRTSDLVNYEIDNYPDFFIDKTIYEDLSQDIKEKDVLFSKDGKIGMSALVCKNDKFILSSGLIRARLIKEKLKIKNISYLTQEYLFLILSLREIGHFQAIRRTVVASTIPHLREGNINKIEIPILDEKTILEITNLISKSFEMKNKKKVLINEIRTKIDDYFNF